jgi:hypothetical protein
MPAAAFAPEEEIDLLAEIAAIEEELARSREADAPTEDADGSAQALSEVDPEAEEVAAGSTQTDPDAPRAEPVVIPPVRGTRDLERLFAATDSRLSGGEAEQRRRNISHLKAAVAAGRADASIRVRETRDESGAYRSDLADRIGPPPRPAEVEAVLEAPRVAPLVLVSEQRVEERRAAEAEADETPSDPDPIETAARRARIADIAEDFERFAEEVGAIDLTEVLEAAAVYSTTVMGQASFSRPRLLHLAAEAVDDLSREDGLRGFGQLLREGTLRKVDRGTFTLGTQSRFQAVAERRVG